MKDFLCNRCGKCCVWDGIAHVFPEDYWQILQEHGIKAIDREAFDEYFELIIEEYVLHDGIIKVPRVILRWDDSGCVFFKNGICQIHSVKPMICRTAPLNYSVLSSERIKSMFAAICEPFKELLPCEGLSRFQQFAGVREELSYEYRYLSSLKCSKVRELYHIDFGFRWSVLTSRVPSRLSEVWGQNGSEYLDIYASAI